MNRKAYLLGHNGDLDKADEEENKRGAGHIGTKSVIHLLGVLRGDMHCERYQTRPPLATVQPIPVTHRPRYPPSMIHGDQSWAYTEDRQCRCPYGGVYVTVTERLGIANETLYASWPMVDIFHNGHSCRPSPLSQGT